MLAMIRFLFFFFVLFALFSLSAPVPCFAYVTLDGESLSGDFASPKVSLLKRHPIPDSTIGQKGNTYISPTGSTPSTKFAKTPSGGLGRKALRWGMFLGKNAIGGAVQGVAFEVGRQAIGHYLDIGIDLGKAYMDKKMQDYQALRDPLRDALGYGDFPDEGAILQCPGGNARVTRFEVYSPFCSKSPPSSSSFGLTKCEGTKDVYRLSSKKVCADDWYTIEKVRYYLEPYTPESPGTDPANPGTDPTNPSNYPDRLNDEQLKSLADKLDELLQKNDQLANDIADALDDLINKNPDYLDWDPIPARDFEDAILQDKINDALQSRENATDPAEIKQLDDLIDRLMNQKNRLDLDRQKEQERKQEREKRRQERADKDKPDTCNDSNNNCNNDCNNNNNNCNNCPDGKCEVECKVEEKPFEPPDTPKPELKSIDFQPIVDLKGKLMEKFPFCLLTAFGSAIDVLTADPIAPWCEFTLGFGKPIVLDLSILDSAASFIRGVMSFCIFGLCGFGCFRMWSRF